MARLAKAGAVRMVHTLASLKAVFLCRSLHRKVLAHPPAAVPVKGPSAKVIQLPDMKLSKNTGGKFTPLLSIPKNLQVTKRFLKFFLDLSWFLLFGIGLHGNYFAPSPNNGQKNPQITPPSRNFFEEERDGAGEGLHTPLTPHRTLIRAKEGVVSKICIFDKRVAGREVCVKWEVGKSGFSRSGEGQFPPLLLLPQLAGAKTELIF